MLVGQIEDEFINGVTDSRALDPSAYHITHEGNLDKLFELGCLFCDSHVRQHAIPHIQIGYKHTKLNRLGTAIPITEGLSTGDCVPFYYCPRSVMLNVIFQANSPDLATHFGENPVVHLRFNVKRVWDWAVDQRLRVFITNANAAASHAEVFSDLRALKILNWGAIAAKYWNEGSYKTDKAAELLVENRVSLGLLEEIGVKDPDHQRFVNDIILRHPRYRAVPVNIHAEWYYGR